MYALSYITPLRPCFVWWSTAHTNPGASFSKQHFETHVLLDRRHCWNCGRLIVHHVDVAGSGHRSECDRKDTNISVLNMRHVVGRHHVLVFSLTMMLTGLLTRMTCNIAGGARDSREERMYRADVDGNRFLLTLTLGVRSRATCGASTCFRSGKLSVPKPQLPVLNLCRLADEILSVRGHRRLHYPLTFPLQN